MTDVFDLLGDVRTEIADLLRGELGRGLLRREARGQRSRERPSEYEPTTQEWPFDGFLEKELTQNREERTLVTIIGGTLPQDVGPRQGDVITYPAEGGQTYRVEAVAQDPVQAVYQCRLS